MKYWEILYEDGSVFTSGHGEYWEAPRVGVLVVLQGDDHVGVKILYSPDGWWIWKEQRWFGCTREGKDDYRRTYMRPDLCILEGRWTTDDKWFKIQERIRDRKSAWYRYERRVKDPDG